MSNFGIEPLTLFPAQSRRRRRDVEGETPDRAAFRLCVFRDQLPLLLQEQMWPAEVTISEWFFKSGKSGKTDQLSSAGKGLRKDIVLGDIISDKLNELRQVQSLQGETSVQSACNVLSAQNVASPSADRVEMVKQLAHQADVVQQSLDDLSTGFPHADWGSSEAEEPMGTADLTPDAAGDTFGACSADQSSCGPSAAIFGSHSSAPPPAFAGGGVTLLPRAHSSPDVAANISDLCDQSSVSLQILAHTQVVDLSCGVDATIVAAAAASDDHDFLINSEISLSNNFTCLKDGATE
jgi:hypothetical protein